MCITCVASGFGLLGSRTIKRDKAILDFYIKYAIISVCLLSTWLLFIIQGIKKFSLFELVFDIKIIPFIYSLITLLFIGVKSEIGLNHYDIRSTANLKPSEWSKTSFVLFIFTCFIMIINIFYL